MYDTDQMTRTVTRCGVLPSVRPDEANFAETMVHLTGQLRRRAYRLTQDATQAEDLLQDTMAKAWSARASFRHRTNLQAWTYTILRNQFLSDQRQMRRVVGLDDQTAARLPASYADQHEQAGLRATLSAIDDPPPEQGLAIRAIALEGLDYDTAATVLHVLPAALKRRVWRAGAALRKAVDERIPRRAEAFEARAAKPANAIPDAPRTPASHKGVWKMAKAAGKPLWIG